MTETNSEDPIKEAEPPMVPLADALALTATGEGRLSATITPGWDVRGIPHGGFLLALVAKAGAHVVAQPDPLSVSASYLAPPAFGPAELTITPVRLGKRQSTVVVDLSQEGLTRVHATVTFGTIPRTDAEYPAGEIRPVPLAPPEQCLATDQVSDPDGEPIRLHRQLHLRLSPDTGWVDDNPRGVAEIDGWMHIGADPDPYALLVFSDGMPPSLFEARGRDIGHVPTMQLTTHVFARPRPGWVQGHFASRVVNGSYVDEDGYLWDTTGRLVATTRQLALVR